MLSACISWQNINHVNYVLLIYLILGSLLLHEDCIKYQGSKSVALNPYNEFVLSQLFQRQSMHISVFIMKIILFNGEWYIFGLFYKLFKYYVYIIKSSKFFFYVYMQVQTSGAPAMGFLYQLGSNSIPCLR